ncbi:MAG: hypothetical protein GY868_02310 [Deltaproteobacteria bacterium]|nr:hypothetical protein [Deltaproteobacteria bacterium]
MPTATVLAWFEYLAGAAKPLKNRARIRFHVGTSELIGRAVLLDADELQPGESGFVRFDLEKPTVLLPRDRYVVRSYSPVDTVGGGEIIDNCPPRLKRMTDDAREYGETLKDGDLQAMAALVCRAAGPGGLVFARLVARLGVETKKLQAMVEKMQSAGRLVVVSKNPQHLSVPEVVGTVENGILAKLKEHHTACPLKEGMLREELRAGLPRGTDMKVYEYAVARLLKKKKIKSTKEFLALPGHAPALQQDQEKIKADICGLYQKGGIAPPTRKELLEQLKVPGRTVTDVLGMLVREGVLVKLNDDTYYEIEALAGLVEQSKAYLQQHGELSIKSFKDLTGLSRKFSIPLFEYMDRNKITLRKGDVRVLRKGA